MKNRVVFFGLVAWLAACGGDGASKEAPRAEAPGQRGGAEAPQAGEASADTEAAPSEPGETLSLSARPEAPAEAAPFELTLEQTADGRIQGSGEMAGRRLRLHGALDEGQLRVWVSSEATAPGEVLRGYLIGEISDNKGGGTFAISGNAGVPSYRGVWERTAVN